MNRLRNQFWTPRAIDALVAAVVAGYDEVALRYPNRYVGAGSFWKELLSADSWQGVPPAQQHLPVHAREYVAVPKFTTEPGAALALIPILLSWGYRTIIYCPKTSNGSFRIDLVSVSAPADAEPVVSWEDPMLEMGLSWAALALAAERDRAKFSREVSRIESFAAPALPATERTLAGV